MKTMRPALVFIFSFIAASVFAQAPELINYQGIARDVNGLPISNQEIELRMSILDDITSLDGIYVETHNISTNNYGLFTLKIGGGNNILGELENIDWGINEHFLKVEIKTDNYDDFIVLGTNQLLSVPYALYAKNTAEGYWKKQGDDYVLPQGNASIGENSTIYTDLVVNVNEPQPPYIGNITIINKDHSSSDEASYGAITCFGNDILPNSAGARLWGIGSAGQNSHDLAVYNDRPGAIIWGVNGNYTAMALTKTGNLGIGNKEAKSKLQVTNGDVYIDNPNRGVIMTSPNGACWRLNVDNDGNPVFESVECPD